MNLRTAKWNETKKIKPNKSRIREHTVFWHMKGRLSFVNGNEGYR